MPDNPDSLPDRRINQAFDAAKRMNKKGTEYWLARDLQQLLGYTTWRTFEEAVTRAKMACESSGTDTRNHFADVNKMIPIGKGAQRQVTDVAMTRYGVYLTAMNGDPSKPEIAAAMTYFAVQTRRQELSDQQDAVETRIKLRDRVKSANTHLASAAKHAGVENFGLFHDAGYRGLYSKGLQDIKMHKGIGAKEDLLDRAGRAELAANEFRITQTEDALSKQGIVGDQEARVTHRRVGSEVRATIKKIGGTMPEDLPPEPSIKKLRGKQKPKELPGGN
ncbi:MAG: DNA damage-inducible protein D [Dehalococcoidia bacterium]|nr:DNA damage-inducible protein D [Dehalococcoidia bacterium]